MTTTAMGILHPGSMGASVAASARDSGHDVFWASERRSKKTRERAESVGLQDIGTLEALCRTCSIIISVCPPHAAEEVASQVLSQGFGGLYVDANAVSPQVVKRIGHRMLVAGVAFVDGGIIGGPAWEPGTCLYLSGPRAGAIPPLFAGGLLGTAVIGNDIGQASALKMCYAAYTKGTTALLSTILAAADAYGVWPDLEQQWEQDWPGFSEQAVGRARRVTAKAWRFAGEMEEIASTFEFVGLPGGFHRAAADLYRRLARFRDAPSTPALQEVLSALLDEEQD